MLASHISYLRLPKGSVVFDYGSIGDLFYFILEGLVSVRTPLTDFEAELLIKTATYKTKVSFFQTEDDEYENSQFEMEQEDNVANESSKDIEQPKFERQTSL